MMICGTNFTLISTDGMLLQTFCLWTKRQEELRERVKWQYKKRDSSYWNDGAKQAAAKKVARISTSVPPATPLPPAMTESQLRKNNSSPFLSREQGRDSTPKQENKI